MPLNFSSRVLLDGSFTFSSVPSGAYTLSANDAKITGTEDGTEDDRHTAQITVATFASGKTTVIVKDSDLDDAILTLTEVPTPAPKKTESDDDH